MEQIYTLTCDICGKPFESDEAFPKSQLCPKCQATEKNKLLLFEAEIVEAQAKRFRWAVKHGRESEARESADRMYEYSKKICREVFGERPPIT